jgi:hypothetical protein
LIPGGLVSIVQSQLLDHIYNRLAEDMVDKTVRKLFSKRYLLINKSAQLGLKGLYATRRGVERFRPAHRAGTSAHQRSNDKALARLRDDASFL